MNEKIADALRAEIATGRLKPGDKLPAVRDIAERFEVAAGTATKALQLLARSGYARAESTRGYFVTDRPEAHERRESSAEFELIRQEIESLRAHIACLEDRLQRLENSTQNRQ
ncbi:winged helix-turn-helix domain-containing protein [Streptomyces thioluteus]|uniref:winged helix-turn-helix domain-containing protein n=1 Tax=Streptomyces thioluteus TaxID=66431 RepID=UPI0031F163EE